MKIAITRSTPLLFSYLRRTCGRALIWVLLIFGAANMSAQCPSGEVFINNQAELDAFVNNFGGCSEMPFSFVIQNSTDIFNVDGLSFLNTIGGNLIISNNANLQNLDGLDNLTAVPNGIQIASNSILNNVNFLGDLQQLNQLIIANNASLQSVVGPMASQMGFISISSNPQLQTITGFGNLTTITIPTLGIDIVNNQSLQNLGGFGLLANNAGANISVVSNGQLQMCDVPLLCRQIAFGNSPTVSNNGCGCSSLQEVTDQCNGDTPEEADGNNPTITNCQPVTATLDADGNATLTLADLTFTANDNCGVISTTASPLTFSCSTPANQMITITVEDQGGNTATCMLSVTVNRNTTPPVFSKSFSPAAVNMGEISTLAFLIDNSSSACTVDDLAFVDNLPAGMTVATSPNLTTSCSASATISASAGSNTISLSGGEVAGGGVCTISVDVQTNGAGEFINFSGDLTSSAGNSGTASATLTVNQGNRPPVADCAVLTVDADGNCQYVATAAEFNGSSSDPDGDQLTFSIDPAGPFGLGTTSVELTVSDGTLSGVCTTTITVTDNEDPTVTDCQDLNIDLDADGNATLTLADLTFTTTDNCAVTDTTVTPLTFNCDTPADQMVTITVADNAGNTASCMVEATVMPPAFTCPGDQEVILDGSGVATLENTITFRDTIFSNAQPDGTGSIQSYTIPGGISEVRITAAGGQGGRGTTTDGEVRPGGLGAILSGTFSVVPNSTLQLLVAGRGSTIPSSGGNSTSGGGGGATFIALGSDGAADFTEQNTLLIAGGGSGADGTAAPGASSEMVNFILIDQGGTAGLASSGGGSLTEDGEDRGLGSTGGTAAIRGGAGGLSPRGPGGYGAGGGSSPGAGALRGGGGGGAPGGDGRPFAAAAAGSFNGGTNPAFEGGNEGNGYVVIVYERTVDFTPNTFSCADISEPVQVTVSQTDACGNLNSCTIEVTVTDNMAPTLTNCQPVTATVDEDGIASITLADLTFTAADNCSLIDTVASPLTFDCTASGDQLVTITVTDAANQTASCQVAVTLNDIIPPTLTCRDTILFLDEDGLASVDLDVLKTATDNCAVTPFDGDVIDVDCSVNSVGSVAVDRMVTDLAGNPSPNCRILVDIRDTFPIDLTCQDVTVDIEASGSVVVDPEQAVASASDDCTLQDAISDDNLLFTCSDVGVPRMITIRKGNVYGAGTFRSCTVNVTVNDPNSFCNGSPTAICQAVTTEADATCTATAVAETFDGGSTDPEMDDLTFTVAPAGPYPVGTTNVQLTVSDGTLSSSCQTTITVTDNAPPTITNCAPVSADLDANGVASITLADLTFTTADNCGVADTVASPLSFNCDTPDDQEITITVTDDAGNPASCTVAVTVNDVTPPTISNCQDVSVDLDDQGNATLELSDLIFTASDNCAVVDTVAGPLTFNCDTPLDQMITIVVTDGAGLSEDCLIAVTVNDVTPPALTNCQPLSIDLDGNGIAVADLSDLAFTATDNCALIDTTASPLTFNCDTPSDQMITLTVRDNANLETSCLIAVTVNDVTPPSITDCGNVLVDLDASGEATIDLSDLTFTAADNCGLVDTMATPLSFDCMTAADQLITITVTDGADLSAQCQVSVMVNDVTPPTLVDCQPVSVELDELGAATLTLADLSFVAFDNCAVVDTVASPLSFDCATPDDQMITLQVIDAAGETATCQIAVTVTDVTPPTLTNCQPVQVTLDGAGSVTLSLEDLTFTASDNCEVVDTTATPLTFTCDTPLDQTILLTIEDATGLTAGCSIEVMIEDNVAPTIVCRDTTLQIDMNGLATLDLLELVVSTSDNCAVVDTFDIGEQNLGCDEAGTVVSLEDAITVSDLGGNTATCDVRITVMDTIRPVITPEPIPTIFLDSMGTVTIDSSFLAIATDNCDVATVRADRSLTFDCNDVVGQFTFELTATDVNGNANTETITVEVADTIAPAVSCSDTLIALNGMGIASLNPADVIDSIREACGLDGTFLNSLVNFDCSAAGQDFDLQVLARDINGNVGSCDYTVMVRDTTPPTLMCIDTTVAVDFSGQNDIPLGRLVDRDDNCPAAGNDDQLFGFFTVTCNEVGTTVSVPFNLSDASGNRSQCSSNVTVIDTTPPQLFCFGEVTVFLDSAGMDTTNIEQFANGFDNCGEIQPVTPNPQIFDCSLADSTRNFTLTRRDASGNEGTCTVAITIRDTIAPMITVADVTTFGLGEDGTLTIDLDTLTTETDNCQVFPPMPNVITFTAADLGDNDFTITRTDAVGNTTTIVLTVTIVDNIPPVLVCRDTTVALGRNGQVSLEITQLVVATDNDQVIDVMADIRGYNCDSIGTITYTQTRMDPSGNSSSCETSVTVVDTLAPEVTVQNVTVFLDASGVAMVSVADVVVDTFDNCGVAEVEIFRDNPNTGAGASFNGGGAGSGNNALAETLFFNCDDEDNSPVTIFVQATDVNGNQTTTTALVAVVDTIAPVITITPADVTLDLNGNAVLLINDIAAANDNCGIATVEATRLLDFGCDDIGLTFIQIIATDVNGNVSMDSVPVTIDFEQPRFACIDRINITLSDDCSAELIPRMVLTGNTACIDNFQFEITVMDGDTTNGPVIDGCGQFTYKIRNIGTGFFDLDFDQCWGTVYAEDKTPPVLVETPDNILSGLLCADVDANNVNLLGPGVSKCFRVDGGGTIVDGSIDPRLLAVLSPAPFDNTDDDTALIPIFTDNCASEIEVCVSDIVTRPADGCGQTIIERFFRANEVSGCAPLDPDEDMADDELVTSFTISFDRPTLDSLDAMSVRPVVEIEACGNLDSPLNFVPNAEDFPVLTLGERTFSLGSPEIMCSMIAVTYENSPNVIQTCDNTVKFQRTYTVVDWCVPTDVRTFTQFVKVGDTTGPDFTGPSMTLDNDGNPDAELTYRTNVGAECAAVVRLDGPGVAALDACDGNDVMIVVSIYPEGDLTRSPYGAYPVDLTNGAPEVSAALPLGDYAFVYTATDGCGNATVTTVPFTVVDGSGPSAICENGLNVSLSRPGGTATLTPAQFDQGSADDCSDALTYGIAYGPTMDVPTEFFDAITFTCADLGVQFVTLEVTDEAGNSNTCWGEVLVELKANDVPTCIAPSAVTLTCMAFDAAIPGGNLEEATEAELNAAFGTPGIVSTCEATVTTTFVVNNLNECGVGTAVRSYRAVDQQGGVSADNCTQLITIVGVYDYQIVLPGDVTTSDCMDEFAAEELSITGGACDVPVVTTVTEEVFDTPGAECYQIRTTYTIINTCEYDPALGGTTLITRDGLDVDDESVFYLNVTSRNAATTNDDLAFTSGSANGQFTPNDDDDNELTGYATSAGRGSFTYVQTINVNDRTSPTVNVTAPADCLPGCTAEVSLPFTATDDCLAPTITLELDPDFTGVFAAATVDGVVITLDETDAGNGNYVVNATGIPAGDHALRITATDGCGNATPVIVPVSVCGDVAPVPLCIQTLVATLQMNDANTMAMAEVWATDFLTNSPLLDCFGDEVTKFGIVRSGEGPATIDQAGAKVFCDDVAELVSFEVYAFSDNLSDDVAPAFCNVLVQVEAGDGVECGTPGNISGTVLTRSADPVAAVEVTLTGSNDMDEMLLTDENGQFIFMDLPLGGDFTATPVHQEPVNLQEVKISDVVMISSVILGTHAFESPYDYVAADVTQDGTINVLDMVAIQRVILGLDDNYRTGDTWLFVAADHPLTVDNWMNEFPAVYNANDLAGNVLDADFVAVEMGNVTRGAGRTSLYLETEDAELESGQEHTITFANEELHGFQGTFRIGRDLEILDVSYEGEGGVNLNYLSTGLIGIAMRTQSTVIIKVRAINAVTLSDAFEFTDELVVQEGILADGGSTGLGLAFTTISAPATAQNKLLQNTPNPVTSTTVIPFELAAAGEVTLTLRDARGRVIQEETFEGSVGYNEVAIARQTLRASGVVIYTIVSGEWTASKRMILTRR